MFPQLGVVSNLGGSPIEKKYSFITIIQINRQYSPILPCSSLNALQVHLKTNIYSQTDLLVRILKIFYIYRQVLWKNTNQNVIWHTDQIACNLLVDPIIRNGLFHTNMLGLFRIIPFRQASHFITFPLLV